MSQQEVDVKKILKLVAELKSESYYHGYHLALYQHAAPAAFHTSEKRSEMLNRAAIADKIEKEIKHELEPKP